MAWTANLDSITLNGANVVANVTYTSDTGSAPITEQVPGNDLTPDTLAAFVANRVHLFELRDLAAQLFTPGPIALPNPTDKQAAELASFTTLAANKVPAPSPPVQVPPAP